MKEEVSADISNFNHHWEGSPLLLTAFELQIAFPWLQKPITNTASPVRLGDHQSPVTVPTAPLTTT